MGTVPASDRLRSEPLGKENRVNLKLMTTPDSYTNSNSYEQARADLRTLNSLFFRVVDRAHERVMMFNQKVKWISISSRELYRNVVGTARELKLLGVKKGDRVAILSENRPEWAVADFASLAIGAITVPVYSTLTTDQTAYLLRDSGAKVAFVSTADQMRKLLAIKDQTAVEKLIVMDYVGTPEAIPMHRMMNAGPWQRDSEFDREALAIDPDDIATIIYTSGTTGTPKGAMLTQGNLASNLLHSLDVYDFETGDDVGISFLPLSHVTARHLDYALLYHGVTVAYCPYFDELPAALQQIKPTVFVAVPRVYEKVYSQVVNKTGSGIKKKIYDWALGVGRQHRHEIEGGRIPTSIAWKIANSLCFSKIRQGLGGNVRILISGGAPLNRELAEWYLSVGLRIHEGYGLTETSPVIALNNPGSYKLGTVGRPLTNLQVRLDDDGELLVRGPSVFKGYWNLPNETAAAFTEDGWFRTGDIASIDNEGFISITDRKKDLIKTSGGKFVAPQMIEALLKASDWITETVLIGDRRKFPAVLIAPNFAVLEPWARKNGIVCSSRQELLRDPRVFAIYKDLLDRINSGLAQYEKVKKFLLIPDEFSMADGTLTPTMKLRRRVVEDRYRQQIEELYSGNPGEAISA
jgi:long-chain acyl-CoA synthetase